jgi:hypothetical protein
MSDVITPQPGDFCRVPVSGRAGLLVEAAQWLDGDRFQPYDHAEIYAGGADDKAPYGYTISAYPDGQRKIALPVPAVNPVFAALTGLIVLGQSLKPADWLAIAVIVTVSAVGAGGASPAGTWRPWSSAARRSLTGCPRPMVRWGTTTACRPSNGGKSGKA